MKSNPMDAFTFECFNNVQLKINAAEFVNINLLTFINDEDTFSVQFKHLESNIRQDKIRSIRLMNNTLTRC